MFANGETNEEWDAIWTVATRRSDQGWSAEFAIPFKSLNFPPEGTVWGFNISRQIQRKFEEVRWAGARFETEVDARQINLTRFSIFLERVPRSGRSFCRTPASSTSPPPGSISREAFPTRERRSSRSSAAESVCWAGGKRRVGQCGREVLRAAAVDDQPQHESDLRSTAAGPLASLTTAATRKFRRRSMRVALARRRCDSIRDRVNYRPL